MGNACAWAAKLLMVLLAMAMAMVRWLAVVVVSWRALAGCWVRWRTWRVAASSRVSWDWCWFWARAYRARGGRAWLGLM